MATPLSIDSPRLKRSRFEVSLHGEMNERGGYPQITMGRFATQEDAQAWADEHAEAFVATITYLSATRGWERMHVNTRRGGQWERPSISAQAASMTPAIPYAEIDCGWRMRPYPRFRVTLRYEGGVWHVYEVYTDGREMLVRAFEDKGEAREFGWAHRSDDA